MYEFPDGIYEIPDLKVLLILNREGNTLVIADIVCEKLVAFTSIKSCLRFEGIDTVQFGFNPDWLGIDYSTKPCVIEDNHFFIKGDFGIREEFIIPLMIRT